MHKRYGDVAAVHDLDLAIGAGEFFTLLGPSGSGKTTLLRMIAGFERPDAGRIELAGRDVTRVPPCARHVNTVFQDYALFPHMTVAQDVEYGLRVRRIARGGQRQRVALARAIVNEPQVLLLDELRPEKITLLADDEPEPGGSRVEAGIIREVSYAGVLTRYIVDLDSGGELVVARQSMDLGARGAIRLGQQLPEVNAVVTVVIALTLIPDIRR